MTISGQASPDSHGTRPKRQLLFSVTAADCDWSYTRGTGNGGQAKNKTSSAVHCTHRASKAHGYAEDSRVQRQNRSTAFERMCNTKEFKAWHKLEVSRKTGQEAIIEKNVERAMKQIRVDVKEDGLWKAINKDMILKDGEE
jgi:protein subunit release factor B